MTQEDITIPAADGLPLAASVFRPTGRVQGWCSIGAANGVQRRYYRRFATHLAGRGIATVTFDYRGIGESPPEWEGDATHPPTGPPTMQMFGERDLEGVLQWIDAARRVGEWERLPVVHVGHSGGGQFLGLAPSNRLVSAAAIFGSQSGYWRLWPKYRAKMWMLWHVLLPGSTRLRGHFPAGWFGMGEPLPKSVALQWARWCRHPDFIIDDEGRPIREHFAAWPGRLRAYVITDDLQFAPRPATEALVGFYSGSVSELVDLNPSDLDLESIGHFGYFTKKCEPHWDGLADWLLAPPGPPAQRAST